MATQEAHRLPHIANRKAFIRRLLPDRSQRIRRIVQGLFALLNVWLGIQLYVWVRYFERGGTGLYLPHPAGAEGWLPIVGLMNLKCFLVTGQVPTVHPSAMFLFIAFLLMSVLLKKAFCSWLCPVGTLSESLWKLGRKAFGRNLRLKKWIDIPLRSLKYLLLGFFVYVIASISVDTLKGFLSAPFALVADVKMLNFFRDLSRTAAIVLVVLVFGSMLVQNFWCRYLCPYGALLGLVSFLSPVKIRRDADACIDCGRCARVCPANLDVDKLVQIRSVECTACMTCVAACPAEHALQFALPPRHKAEAGACWNRRAIGPVAVTLMLAYIFFGLILCARTTNHWQTNIPRAMYMELVPHASELGHPGV